MYCPNCGKENSVEQRFCRSCGLGLQAVSQALAHELSVTESPDNPVGVISREQKGWQPSLLYGFLIIMLGLIIAVFGKLVLAEKLVSDIGAVLALLGVALLGFKGVLIMLPQAKATPSAEALPEDKATTMLPPGAQSVDAVSVTEQTTRTLEPAYRERKSE